MFPVVTSPCRKRCAGPTAAEVRPNEKQAYLRAELWRPYRGVAAHLLWAATAPSKREIAPF
jgi:DNA-3-methyladenine glycosylase II